MFEIAKNSKAQGDIGLGAAIGYFTSQGYTVSIPLTDSQDYDLIVDINGKLNRVQVKTTSYKAGKNWNFNLSVKGGNRSYNTIKKFQNTSVDYVFILTSDGTKYLIPSVQIKATGTMTLTTAWDACKI